MLEDVLPLINSSVIDHANLSLSTAYVPQSFKLTVIKLMIKSQVLIIIF